MVVSLSFEPFALWHARRHTPALAGTPLIAVAQGRVVAADPLARSAGIELGMSRAGARARSAALHEVAAGGPDLESAWRGVVMELYALTPRLEPATPGVVSTRLGETEGRAAAAAFGIRAGAARNREHARLLAIAARPGTLRDGGATAVAQLPLAALRGIGVAPATLQRLAWLGLERIGELQSWSATQLAAFFGPGAAPVVRHLHGPFEEGVPLFVPPATVRARLSFDEPAAEPALLEPALARLASAVAAQLGDRVAGRLTLQAEAQGIAFSASRVAKLPLRDPAAIERSARLALADCGAQPLGIDELHLELGELTRPGRQGGLWPQRERIERAVAEVERRYPGCLLRVEAGDPYALAFEHRARLVPWSGERPAEGGKRAGESGRDRRRSAQRVAEPRG